MKAEEMKIEVEEFEAIGFDKNSSAYKDTKQAIDGEIEAETATTSEKLKTLQANEKALIEKAKSVQDGLKNDALNELAKIDIDLQLAQLDPFENQLIEFKSRFDNAVYNLDDAKEMKQAKSDSFEISKAVSSLDKKYSKISEPINEIRQRLLSKRKSIKDGMRGLQDKVKSQITKHELAIQEHLEMLDNKVQHIDDCGSFDEIQKTSGNIQKRIDYLNSLEIDESYEHCQEMAIELKTTILTNLQNLYDETLQAEKDAKELEELRKLKAENEQKERDRLIAEKAAEQAKIEAEQKAQAEIERAKQALVNAELEKQQAITNERLRIEREQEIEAQKEAELKAREALKISNLEHRAIIHKQAKESLIKNGIGEDIAVSVISLIKDNMIDNISINY